jgi:iron complex outermembrane receptor protein
VQFVDEGTDYSGKELPGIPKQVFSLAVSAEPVRSFVFNYTYLYSGRQYINDNNTIIYPGHQLSNLSLSHEFTLSQRLSIKTEAGIRNIFDRRYAGMLLINAPSFGGSQPRYYYPGEPRSLYFGMQFRFI